jgi:hypothetical protein
MSIHVELLCDKRNGGSVARKRVVSLDDLEKELDSIPNTEVVRRIRIIEFAVLDEKKFGTGDKAGFNEYISKLCKFENGAYDWDYIVGLNTDYWDDWYGNEYIDYENLWETK